MTPRDRSVKAEIERLVVKLRDVAKSSRETDEPFTTEEAAVIDWCADVVEYDLSALIAEGPQPICRMCHQPESAHCDMDEPGLDHPATCGLMHHEFKAEGRRHRAMTHPELSALYLRLMLEADAAVRRSVLPPSDHSQYQQNGHLEIARIVQELRQWAGVIGDIPGCVVTPRARLRTLAERLSEGLSQLQKEQGDEEQ